MQKLTLHFTTHCHIKNKTILSKKYLIWLPIHQFIINSTHWNIRTQLPAYPFYHWWKKAFTYLLFLNMYHYNLHKEVRAKYLTTCCWINVCTYLLLLFLVTYVCRRWLWSLCLLIALHCCSILLRVLLLLILASAGVDAVLSLLLFSLLL